MTAPTAPGTDAPPMPDPDAPSAPRLPPLPEELFEFYPSMSAATHEREVMAYARAALTAMRQRAETVERERIQWYQRAAVAMQQKNDERERANVAEAALTAANARIAELTARVGRVEVPDGCVLVRRDADPAIIAAGWAVINSGRERRLPWGPGPGLREAWPAMVAAALAGPAPAVSGEGTR